MICIINFIGISTEVKIIKSINQLLDLNGLGFKIMITLFFAIVLGGIAWLTKKKIEYP